MESLFLLRNGYSIHEINYEQTFSDYNCLYRSDYGRNKISCKWYINAGNAIE